VADALAQAGDHRDLLRVVPLVRVVRVVRVIRVIRVGDVAVPATADLRVAGALATGGGGGRRACRLAPSADSVEGTSGLVAPKSVLIIVVVEHFVTPSKGPALARTAVKMTICLLPL